jgi:hypothetical protein
VSPPGRRASLASGFAAIRSGRAIVLLLTAATIVLSLLAAAPLGPSIEAVFARTLAGDHVLFNDPKSASTDVFDFLHEKAPAISGAASAARWAALLILLQQILVAGGIVVVLNRPGGFTAAEFAGGVRRNAWHNLKCFLLFLVFAGIVLSLWLGGMRAAARKLFENVPPGAPAEFAWRIATLGIALFLYAIFSLLHDFARASRRLDPSIGAWRAYRHARRLLAGRWLRALGLFLFWLILGGVLLGGGVLIEWTAPAVSAAAIFLHILLQVVVLAIRPALRVAAWGSYLALYDDAEADAGALAAPPAPEPVIAPVLTLEDHPLI